MNPPERVLLERESLLEVLDAALESAGEGGGQTVLVEGPAGSGKTALLQAAVARAPAHGLRPLTARGSEIEQEFAFGLTRQLLEPALAGLTPATRKKILAGPARPAALALAPETATADASPPNEFAMLHALFLVVSGLAAREPLLVCVDDAHWGDTSSLRALSYTAGRILGVPVALVISMRPDEPGAPEPLLDQLRAEPGAHRLAPTPLGPDSVAAVVRQRLPDADDQACRAAVDATAGNPLYLAELLRAVSDERDRADMAGSIQRAALPTLGDRVTRRIARVADSAPALAGAMAVLGDGGSLATAGRVAGIAQAEAGEIAHRLRRIEILDSEDPFRFVHPLVRRSVYDSLTTTQHDVQHGAAAELLESIDAPPQVVAAHRAAVRPAGSSAAADAMARAAADALARGAPEEAVRWYHRALQEGAPQPTRAELLASLGSAEVTLLDPRALDHLGEALEQSDDPALSARVAATLAPALFASGRWADATDVIEAGQSALGDDDRAAAAELAGIGLLITGYSLALVDRVPTSAARLEELSRGPGWQPRALAAIRAAHAVHQGKVHEARELLDAALEGGYLLVEQERGMWGTSHLLVVLAELDDHERASAVSGQIEENAERAGSMNSLTAAISHRAWILGRQGDLAASVALLRPQIEGAIRGGNPTFLASQLFYLQDALLESSGTEDLVQLARDFDVKASGLAGTWMGAMVHLVRGRIRTADLDQAGAVDDLRAAYAIAQGLSMGPVVAPIGSCLAMALPAGHEPEAGRLVAEELELARSAGLARPLGIALRAAGVLAPDRGGESLLRESVTLLDSCGARVERARSLLALGGTLRRSGARVDARTQLGAAVELAQACGADLLADRARDEMRTAGGRPRRAATTGPDALTASELRVARMAVDGATTREIATALVVSTKTVETHLTHAYAKLGLSGQGARDRLGEALGGY